MTNDWVYDIETFPNIFTCAFEHAEAPITAAFEISDWRNDSRDLIAFMTYLRNSGARLVGFNSLGFDYPVVHTLIRMGKSDARTLYDKAQAIITSQDSDRFTHMVYESDRFLPQIDLFKIHHFDNKARATGLKALEFAMRADSIEDLPFKVGSTLTLEQVPVLKRYNAHDVSQTKKFLHHSKDMIAFRETLCAKYPGRDWLNFSDVKIGSTIFENALTEAGVQLYEYGPEGRKPKQTRRPSIKLTECIPRYVQFQHPEFNRILTHLRAQTITETKGVFKDLSCTVEGLEFVFGTGGIHASVENRLVTSNDEWMILDVDCVSMYPSIAIVNNYYPAHLGESFVRVYDNLRAERVRHKKGTVENAAYKLALNGAYGKSNDPFSVFFDPLFTMSVTLTGQMILAMLVDMLMVGVPGLEVLQGNTDGVTCRFRRQDRATFDQVCQNWQAVTHMTLEAVEYSVMALRDVNNYLAQSVDGKVKRKGAYEWQNEWYQDSSALVVPKVAEKVLLEGAPIRETVENWPDIMDFMIRVKVPRSGYLQYGEAQVQNVSRYLVTKDGKPLHKWLMPLKGKTEWRKFAIESGWKVTVCNNIADARGVVPDYGYYVAEVEKLTNCLR